MLATATVTVAGKMGGIKPRADRLRSVVVPVSPPTLRYARGMSSSRSGGRGRRGLRSLSTVRSSVLAAAAAAAVLAAVPGLSAAGTITNPIINSGADPFVTQFQGQYFY